MIEISNTFILVWLVVLAIICIYLLYMSLTRNNESDSLKTTIGNLVRQNKKRDELINFLMERVETLTGAVNTLTLPATNINNLQEQMSNTTYSSNHLEETTVQQPLQEEQHTTDNTGFQSQFLGTEGTQETQNDPSQTQVNLRELSLDDVLNSIIVPNHVEQHTTQLTQQSGFPEEIAHSMVSGENSHANNLATNNIPTTEIDLTNNEITIKQVPVLNLDDVLNSIPTTFKDDDLISTILGADDSASQHCEEDHTNLPAGKIRLLGMNVKQLKQIAKDMNIKSRGNKTDLVDSIWAKMLTDEVQIETANELNCEKLIEPEELLDNSANTGLNTVFQVTNDKNGDKPQLLVEEFPDDI